MNAEEFIRELKIASPCKARWEDMDGDGQSRFCRQCEKNVYNFTSMSDAEAQQLLLQREGRICGRFYRRRDGTLLTADCPIGIHRRAGRMVYAVILLLLGATATFALAPSHARAARRALNRSQVYQKWDDLVWEVKGWFGIQPRVMGGICPRPAKAAPAPTPAPPTQSSN